jgi:hypothetical protein
VKGVLAALIFSVFLLPRRGDAAEKVITLRFAHFVPATTLEGKTMQDWANEVEKRTHGRIKVNIYPGATLMPATQTYDGITNEVADIGYGIFAYHRGRFPLTEVIDLPSQESLIPTKSTHLQEIRSRAEDVKVLFRSSWRRYYQHKQSTAMSQGHETEGKRIVAKIVNALGAPQSVCRLPIPMTLCQRVSSRAWCSTGVDCSTGNSGIS